MSRPPKKSETIEIRLSHDAKARFMARCQQEELTASEVIRALIEQRLAPPQRRLPHWRVAVAALAGAALGLGAAAPSLARSTDTSRAAFETLDRNHDGVLSFAEYRSKP